MVGIDKHFEGHKTNIPIPRKPGSNKIIWIIVSALITFMIMLFFVLYKRKKAQQLRREARQARRKNKSNATG